MPQMLLPFFPSGLNDINPVMGFEKRDDKVFYFLGQHVCDSHEEDDVRGFRLSTSRLVVNGMASQAEIVDAFKVSAISVKRSVKLIRNEGEEGFFRKRRGRSPHVLTARVLAKVQRLLNRGFTSAETGRSLGLKADTIRKAIARGALSMPKKN